MKKNENVDKYLDYPASDDIYNKSHEEQNIDPENITQLKESIKKMKDGENNEKVFDEDISGDDLDVPGAELDDDNEAIGSEDEENNYYSLGGENYNDLDECKGE
jgi:glutamine synthetase